MFVDGHYIKLLLEKTDNTLYSHPVTLINQLYMRFLRESNGELKIMCIKAMRIVYQSSFKTYGEFKETSHIIYLIENTNDLDFRDSLLEFLGVLVLHPKNVDIVLRTKNSLILLFNLLSLIHTQPKDSFRSSLLQQEVNNNTLLLTNTPTKKNKERELGHEETNNYNGERKSAESMEVKEMVSFKEWRYK